MGLIYDPNDSRNLLSALNANINTANEMISGLKRGSKHLVSALESKTLSGAAYTAGKGMFSQVVIPTISKASQALDKLRSEVKQYESFASSAGGELLDEDKLNAQLQSLQAQQVALTGQIGFYNQQALLHPDNSELMFTYKTFGQELSAYMSITADSIQNIQKKLRKLYEFNTNVSGLFHDTEATFANLSTVISAIGSGNFDANGRFKVSGSKNKNMLLDILSNYGSGAVQDGISEAVSGLLSNIDDAMPNAGPYMRVFTSGNKYWTNTHINWDGAGYGKAVSNSMFKKGIKNVTVNKFGIGKAKISGLGALGFGIDYYQNRADGESVGTSFAHTAATTTVAGVGVWGVGTGISMAAGTSLGTALGLGSISAAITSNPIGWAVGAGIGAGILTKIAYDNNFLGFKDGVKSAGKAIDSGIKNVKSFFGWGKKKYA